MKEKRLHPRVSGALPIKISSDSNIDLVTETHNISASGVFCAVESPIDEMTKINIVLLVPVRKNTVKSVKKINCKGVVVRNTHVPDNGKNPYWVGIFFNDIKDKDRKIIHDYISNTLNAAPAAIPHLH
jgi:hypothetical protein